VPLPRLRRNPPPVPATRTEDRTAVAPCSTESSMDWSTASSRCSPHSMTASTS
jgi:hypothetical protein